MTYIEQDIGFLEEGINSGRSTKTIKNISDIKDVVPNVDWFDSSRIMNALNRPGGADVAIVTIGLPGSGKTSFAIDQALKFRKDSNVNVIVEELSRDSVRNILSDGEYGRENKWDWGREGEVSEYIDSKIQRILSMSLRSVDEYGDFESLIAVFDDTNVNPKFQMNTLEKLSEVGFEVFIAFCDAWYPELYVERILSRYEETGRSVPMSAFVGMATQLYDDSYIDPFFQEGDFVDKLFEANKTMGFSNDNHKLAKFITKRNNKK